MLDPNAVGALLVHYLRSANHVSPGTVPGVHLATELSVTTMGWYLSGAPSKSSTNRSKFSRAADSLTSALVSVTDGPDDVRFACLDGLEDLPL